jgi:nicotinamidase-related amidase
MRHPRVLDSRNTILLIVDMQESFRKHIPDFADLTRNISILVEASKILQLPVFVTEQYPQGLGKTVTEISACLSQHQHFEKNCFSCCGTEPFVFALHEAGRKQVIVCGIEAHVCISQTVHDLLQHGYQPHIISDAIGSRVPRNKEIGIAKMVASGAVLSSVEMALFEMLVESGTEKFKAVQRLVK